MIMIAIVVWSIDVEFGNCGLLPIPLDNLVQRVGALNAGP